jgi:hypothetical protein
LRCFARAIVHAYNCHTRLLRQHSTRPGGYSSCCPTGIDKLDRSCKDVGAPCLLPVLAVSALPIQAPAQTSRPIPAKPDPYCVDGLFSQVRRRSVRF